MKMTLIRTMSAEGKWIEDGGELIRLMNSFALIIPPNVEIAGRRGRATF